MTTVEVLRGAKAVLLERGWGQGKVLPGNCACVAVAFAVVNIGGVEEGVAWEAWLRARSLFRQVAGLPPEDGMRYWGDGNLQLFAWNDAPGRTLEEVHAAFDAAIALAESAPSREAGDR